MSVIKLSGGATLVRGNTAGKCGRRPIRKATNLQNSSKWILHSDFLGANQRKVLTCNNAAPNSGLVSDQHSLNYEAGSSSYVEKRCTSTRERLCSGSNEGDIAVTGTLKDQPNAPAVFCELAMLSLPAIAGQAIEPLAQLMGTAYVGRLGVLELAAGGVSLSIFNVISKVFNIPLLSLSTSFVAEDISQHSHEDTTPDRRRALASVSTALALSFAIGLFEAAAMTLGSGLFLNIMGVSTASPMRSPAENFLRLRAIGAPAVVVSLAIQGIFRGFKDTRTTVLCLGIGNLAAVFFFPVSMYTFRLGITGAAISTVASQYIVTILMLWHLNKRTILQFCNMKNLQFGDYLRSGGFVLGKTVAVATTVTLSTSMVAHLGALSVAAHQICLQVWLAAPLLVEAQASAAQALIASSFAKAEFSRVKEITYAVLKTGLLTGVALAVILGLSLPLLAKLFTTDAQVQNIIGSVILLVSASQPLSALAYVFDGLHYGVSDFPYAGCSMMVIGAISSAFLIQASSMLGLSGIWSGLTLFMGLRSISGFWRLSQKSGPWWFLQDRNELETKVAVIPERQ
ncbi:protein DETOXIFICATION 45, chloroplastic isoform X1 [Coffea arabica]|uniref:Protein DETOXIFICATION n=2 Tax=Coffea arabica TaxID=13443 RepID=A0A6P6TLL5_COFAR|nr:protein DETOXIFICATION 45, chloroplastic-like isoform X1 [Coffea arabica]XP_027079398.1 protein DETOXIFICATION 45, chloroplastic-like isoform X1 [Coffea arabica]